ncbi:aldose 1-epimerase [Novosphingobium sp. BL-8A]|uniref:aldose 1-epimerase n=1 Tax=Novosphingobium sp. BL-8A TaxID=3127639 RepID=UPI0037578318
MSDRGMILAAGDWRLSLDPHRGGMVRALSRRGKDILRPMSEGADALFDSACFPLAPYANRIADGRFVWEGTAHAIAPNAPDQKHPLHGTAWLGEWSVETQGADFATLIHHHAAGADWAWAFTLRQHFQLGTDGLEARLELTNTDSTAMPAGLGFHPWFTREGVTGVAFTAKAVWLADADMLPTVRATADSLGDWSQGAGLERPDLVDHCYVGWSGLLRIQRGDGDVLVEGDGTPFLHFYVPPERDFFCAEPQSTMPDAVNREAPAPLAPGETLTVTMRIRNA